MSTKASPFPLSRRPRIILTSRRRSAGYGGIAIIAILGIVAATVTVTSLNASALRNDQDRKTTYALAQAKQALIGRAASDGSRPGSLPCPDVNNDGLVTMNEDYVGSACVSYVGRLPWKYLGMPDLRDADGERLWYAVSPNFRDLGTVVVNGGTMGTLDVAGNMAVADAAAIVFAAGTSVGNQNRSGANVNAAAQFLDGANGAANAHVAGFQSQAPTTTFNDRMLAVMPTEITSATGVRVTREISAAFDAYLSAGSATLPWAASPSNLDCQSSSKKATSCTAQTGLTTGIVPAFPASTYPASPAAPTETEQAYLNGPLGPNGWFQKNDWRQWVAYTVTAACATSACKESGASSFKVSKYSGNTSDLAGAKSQLTLYKTDSTGMYWTTTTYLVK